MKTDVAGAPSRLPRQERSRASFERMMEAADRLLRERGTDDFTLNEVTRLGKISIGSIYCRFDSKDDLIRAVHERAMVKVDAASSAAIEHAKEQAADIQTLLAGLLEGVAETLREFAPILRPLMIRGLADPVIAAVGRETYFRAASMVEKAILTRRSEISHPDPEHAAAAVYSIAYAAFAHFLGLGAPASYKADIMDWHAKKEDVIEMSVAYLMVQPEIARRRR